MAVLLNRVAPGRRCFCCKSTDQVKALIFEGSPEGNEDIMVQVNVYLCIECRAQTDALLEGDGEEEVH